MGTMVHGSSRKGKEIYEHVPKGCDPATLEDGHVPYNHRIGDNIPSIDEKCKIHKPYLKVRSPWSPTRRGGYYMHKPEGGCGPIRVTDLSCERQPGDRKFWLR